MSCICSKSCRRRCQHEFKLLHLIVLSSSCSTQRGRKPLLQPWTTRTGHWLKARPGCFSAMLRSPTRPNIFRLLECRTGSITGFRLPQRNHLSFNLGFCFRHSPSTSLLCDRPLCCVYMCLHIYIHTCIHTYMYIYLPIFVSVFVSVCV